MKQLGKISIYFRWLARIFGGLTILLFIIFAIGEGLPTLSTVSTVSTVEMIMFICLAIALIGILISWRWSLAGCLLMVVGYFGFIIADKHFTIVSPFSLFPVIVILYVLAWFFDRE